MALTIRPLFREPGLHGMAHITGSGIEGNLERILPRHLDARIDLAKLKVLPVFKTIRDEGNVADAEMLRTYNMGVGLVLVVGLSRAAKIREAIQRRGHDCFSIGEIAKGVGKVRFSGEMAWRA